MERVTGVGGIFFKTKDKQKTLEWYRDHLGIPFDEHGVFVFEWLEKQSPQIVGQTVWSPFAHDTKYFTPGRADFMVNYRVKDLAKMLEQLRAMGAEVDPRMEESEFGKFGWVVDPEGNRIELWEPPPPK